MRWPFRLLHREPTRSPVPLAGDAARVFAAVVRLARRHGHECIGTDHLLLGLAEAGPRTVRTDLARLGATSAALRRRWDLAPGPGSSKPWEPLVLTPYAQRALATAWRAAGQPVEGVGALDLQVALAREDESCARGLLAKVAG